MESSESVDDTFRARVEKVFGSLASSKSSTMKSSPWSLTDDEVERREWRRDTDTRDRDDTPCSASFDECFKKDQRASRRKLRRELDDPNDDGEEQADLSFSDEWEIRSSIGLDSTLDHEDEEDEYDKVATGTENAGDRLFMKDVTDHGSYLNSHNVLTKSKDPRANHLAARIRLKEDEAEGQNNNSDHAHGSEVKEQHVEASEDCNQLRSILKRKANNDVCKSQKRVRFDPSVTYASEEAVEKTMAAPSMEATDSDYGSLQGQNASRVPDYLINPSKYRCYSFDSTSEVDEESNAQACMDFFNLVKKFRPSESGLELAGTSADLPKSVTFIPKKKASDAKAVSDGVLKQNMEEDHKQFLHQAGFPVGIAAGEVQHEVSAMEEDESQTNAADRRAGFQKSGRRYRTKLSTDDDDS